MTKIGEARQGATGSLLGTSGIDAGYESKAILKNVNFSVYPGNLVALLGANGCGKTTLLKTVIGLLPKLGGTSTLSGMGLESLSPARRAKLVSWVPQTSDSAWSFTVRETVAQGRYAYAGPFRNLRETDAYAIDAAMESMDVHQYSDRRVSELSGGEGRRVLIARALAQDTPLLALDEPAAHLDPGRQLELMEILRAISRTGKGVLVSLHDVNSARRYADKVLLIGKNGNLAFGGCDEVLTPTHLEEAYETEFLHGTHGDYGRFVLPLARKKGKPA